MGCNSSIPISDSINNEIIDASRDNNNKFKKKQVLLEKDNKNQEAVTMWG